MAGEWREVALGDIADLVRGVSYRPADLLTDEATGVPLLRATNIRNRALELTDVLFVSPALVRDQQLLRRFDVVIAMSSGSRDAVGRLAQLRRDWTGCIGAFCGVIRADPSRVDPEYVGYVLQSPEFRTRIETYAVGTAIMNLSRERILGFSFQLPNPPEQRAIAHILGTLDDKIELNRKQNETLEAMARALFKAWFVDFEPVRAKIEGRWQRGQSLPGLPAHLYDLFPDRLVESELGEIPEGWRIFSFGDVAHQAKGTVNPSAASHETFTHYSLPAFDAGQMPITESGEAIKSNKTPVPNGAVLVSKLNPHIPRIWLIGKAGKNAVCSTEFIVWVPKAPANSSLLYCLASSPEFNSAMQQLVTGTSNSHQRVKPEQLRDIRVFAASQKAIEMFSDVVSCLMDQVLENRQQSRSLAQLRDTLLPKLISGALRIQDAEAFLKERGL